MCFKMNSKVVRFHALLSQLEILVVFSILINMVSEGFPIELLGTMTTNFNPPIRLIVNILDI